MSKHFFLGFYLVLLAQILMPGMGYASQNGNGKGTGLEKVRLQLKWFHQFQFAGYYAALEKGFFAEAGLDVEIIERDLDKSVVRQVVSGEADYGIGDAGLLSEYAKGEPVVALAAIFQHNPMVFMARQDSGIISPYEMAGKTIMSDTLSANEAPLRAMLVDANLRDNDYTPLQQSNDYSLLTQGKVDVISGYLTDQPYYFKQNDVKINIINPQNYGIDFYGDILFTCRQELIRHPGRADRFTRAALKGWRYALDHPEELIAILVNKYHSKLAPDRLHFEAAETRKLILPDTIPLGQIDLRRLKFVADTYARAGFNKALSEAELMAFVNKQLSGELNLTDAEKSWLAAHPVIRVGIDRDFAPYEWIDNKGRYVGMAADYIKLLEQKLGVHFEIIGDRSWAEVLDLAKKGELDMLSAAVETPEHSEYLIFTEPFKSGPAVIIDNGQGGFIGSLENLYEKRVSVEKGYFMQELLEKNHPRIDLVPAQDMKAALQKVVDGQADAYVGDAASANYVIKKEGLLTLRFSGLTEYRSRHSVAIHKRHPELATIIIKAMDSIPAEQADEIFNRWLGLRIEQGIKVETAVKYALAALVFFLIFAYWLIRLKWEINERKLAELREQHRNRVLRMLTEKLPLPLVLDTIARDIEAINRSMLCSILLLDKDRGRLLHGAAPSLPDFYKEALNGLIIGPGIGCCGTAAHSGQPVIVEDIARHPWWLPYRDLIRKAKLRSCWSQPILSMQGQVLGTFALYHRHVRRPAAADQRLMEDEARLVALAIETAEAENRLQLAANVFTHAREGILISDVDGLILDVNQTFSDISGYARDEVIGQNPRLLKSGRHDHGFYQTLWTDLLEKGYWSGEIWNRHKDGIIYAEMLTISAVRDVRGSIQNFVALFTDITPIKNYQQRLEHLAHYDALTGLPNRVLLSDRLRQAIIHSQRNRLAIAVLYIDLDGFKAINDSHGHDVGDELLINLAKLMKSSLREGDTLARIGGDEFIGVLAGLEHPQDCNPILQRLLKATAETVIVRTLPLQVSASIGVTLYPEDNADADQLIRHADQAMYAAKRSGKNRCYFFSVAENQVTQ
ncbi:ABC transporter substrate-binding protein [Methylomonas rapida]|uniref:Diguanylate cyclase n=1 Tax=Methylomonas rapida TaxID=2963939 RepID=A0ABY7GGZ4_9GAMM|nr:transporter substrate-binding domain-containing protein [Methylomonas rapida]WAR43435.1 diguanylate cyclase [Methylomonas rapida]